MSSSDGNKTCNWGFLSTASIGHKNWQAIKLSGNGQVVAVASRDASKAQTYIDQCSSTVPFDTTPRAIGSYEELLQQDDIDAVYIPLPTGLRKEWVIRAAEHGKHVMCEKPCGCSAVELQEMISACDNNNVQFMDGVMFMHSQRMPAMRKVLESGTIGDIRRIACQFSFNGGDEFEEGNIRTNSDLEPHGCLGDLGWYTIRFALWAMNYQMPISVVGRICRGHQRRDSPNAVPMEVASELQFADGVSASMYNSFVTDHQQWAHISGTKGNLSLRDFVLPYAGTQSQFSVANSAFEVNGCDFEMIENRDDRFIEEAGNSAANSQETNLFRKFADIVNSGQLDPHWSDIALKTQTVLDAVMKSAGNESKTVFL
jgi:predicted dehydrogenase